MELFFAAAALKANCDKRTETTAEQTVDERYWNADGELVRVERPFLLFTHVTVFGWPLDVHYSSWRKDEDHPENAGWHIGNILMNAAILFSGFVSAALLFEFFIRRKVVHNRRVCDERRKSHTSDGFPGPPSHEISRNNFPD